MSGPNTPGHVAIWATPSTTKDGGTASAGLVNSLGLYGNGGTPFGIVNSATPAPFSGSYTILGAGVSQTAAYLQVNGSQGLPFQIQIDGITGLQVSHAGVTLPTPLAPASGGTGLSSTPTNGQLLIGNGTGYTLGTLTAGPGVSITNAAGSVTIGFSGAGTGTVTSVQLATGSTGLTVNGGTTATVTTSGAFNLAGTLALASGGTGVSSIAAGIVSSTGSVLASTTLGAGLSYSAGTLSTSAFTSLAAGSGIAVSGNTITNAGIVSLAAGSGIAVSGNTITNAGIVSLAAGSGIAVSGNTITNAGVLQLGTATGTIALGTNLSITSGTLNASGGSGSGTVNSGTAGQLAYYATSTNAVSGLAVGTGLTVSAGTISVTGTSTSVVSIGSPVTGGTSGDFLYVSGGNLAQVGTTGTGNVVLASSPVLVTPTLGAATATSVNVSGSVGIGTTTPGSKLTVVANTNGNDGLSVSNTSTGASAQAWFNVIAQGWTGVQLIQNQASGTAQLYTADNVSMLFATNAAERMRITAAGKVGIGTSTPSSILTVAAGNGEGIVLQAPATTYGPFLRIQNTGTGGHNWNIVSNGSLDGGGAGNLSIYDATGGGNVLITGNGGIGNVGIGTNAPGSKLTVVANTNGNDGLSVSNTSTGASAQAFLTVVAQSWTGVALAQNQATGNVLIYTADNVPLTFSTNAAERMRITAAGNVGIGTSSPTTKLTVSGSGFNGGSGTFISTTNGNSVAVNGINAAGVNDSAYIYLSDGTNAGFVGLTAQNAPGTVGSLRFSVAGTEYARIQPNGNVGIGTSAPGYLLTVNGTGSFAGAVSVGSMSTSGAVSAGSLTLTTALTAANGGTGLTSAGTSGNVLTSNGSAWVSSAPASPPQIQTQILTVGSGTWTAPTGVTKVYVAVVGGGGGANNTYNGGSGGIAIGEYTVSPGTGYAYTVGAGGAGINTSATANAGGSSSFASFASATGGGAANPTSGTGADGTGTGGTLRNTSTLWTGLSTPMGGYQTTGAATNAASNWGIGSLSQAGAFGYTSAGVGLGANSGGIYLMWVG